jgi:hypothetical protein
MLRKSIDVLERILGTPDIDRGIQSGLFLIKSQKELVFKQFLPRDRKLIEARNIRRVNLALTGGLGMDDLESVLRFSMRTAACLAIMTFLKVGGGLGEIEKNEDRCVFRLRNGVELFGK